MCPNGTLFNQITLVCDWFFNVQCQLSSQFTEYSNSRLPFENAPLLDDQMNYDAYTGALAGSGAAAGQSRPVAPSYPEAAPIPLPVQTRVATVERPTNRNNNRNNNRSNFK